MSPSENVVENLMRSQKFPLFPLFLRDIKFSARNTENNLQNVWWFQNLFVPLHCQSKISAHKSLKDTKRDVGDPMQFATARIKVFEKKLQNYGKNYLSEVSEQES